MLPALGERALSGARLDCRKKKCFFFTLARCRIWTRRFRTRRQRAKPRRLLDSSWFGVPSHARSQGTAFSSGSIEGRRRLYSRAQVRAHAASVRAKWHPSRDDAKNAVGKAESCSIRLLTNHASPESQYIATDPDASSPRRAASRPILARILTLGVLGSDRPNRPPIPSSTSTPKSLGRPVRWAIGLLALWKD